MNLTRAQRVLAMFESRGDVETISGANDSAPRACLARARTRFEAAVLLAGADHWDVAFTTAYDAYRMSAEAIVVALGYRVAAVPGAHRITFDIAEAALGSEAQAFAASAAERFRSGRHESEYFDPERQVDKTPQDVQWALDRTRAAIDAVVSAIG
jgi:hypothetical protein